MENVSKKVMFVTYSLIVKMTLMNMTVKTGNVLKIPGSVLTKNNASLSTEFVITLFHAKDGSDEGLPCVDTNWTCSAGFTCLTLEGWGLEKQCLSSSYVCDGKDFPQGCFHGDQDEENCEQWNCTEGYWKCGDNKTCIPFPEVCDGKVHCNDTSDEMNCERFTCEEDQWKCLKTRNCIKPAQVCDGLYDCPNDSDEKGNNSSTG